MVTRLVQAIIILGLLLALTPKAFATTLKAYANTDDAEIGNWPCPDPSVQQSQCMDPSSITWSSYHDASVATNIWQYNYSDWVAINMLDTYYSTWSKFISRQFYFFDTSSLPSNATVNSVSILLCNQGGPGPLDPGVQLSVQKGSQSEPVVLADYSHFSGSYYTIVSWATTTTCWGSGQFNSTGVSEIVKGGVTKLVIRDYGHDYLNIDPVNDQAVGEFWGGRSDNPINKPYLLIDYIIMPTLLSNLGNNLMVKNFGNQTMIRNFQ